MMAVQKQNITVSHGKDADWYSRKTCAGEGFCKQITGL